VTPDPLPGGAWQALFPRALLLIDEIRHHGGLADPFWTFGGGTVLMLRYRPPPEQGHRHLRAGPAVPRLRFAAG
jgi:hypothetical protein